MLQGYYCLYDFDWYVINMFFNVFNVQVNNC